MPTTTEFLTYSSPEPVRAHYVEPMVYRHRAAYDESVPQALLDERAAYDAALAEYERAVAEARTRWARALAAAIESGMSYAEVSELSGVSHSSISRALKQHQA